MRHPKPARLLTAIALAAATLGTTTAALALDLKTLDASVSPCTDFYAHVNGAWEAATPLPPDRARIGSFVDLRIANDALLRDALAELVAKPALQTTPGLRQLAAFYASAMDLEAIEKQGLTPLQPLLKRIAALDRREELPGLLAALNRVQIGAPLAAFVRADPGDTRRHALGLQQAGLGLPDRDAYFASDATSVKQRQAYRAYAARLLALAGAKAGEAELDALLAFETQLAEASRTRVKLRDPRANYRLITVAELQREAPGLDWAAYFKTLSGRDDGAPYLTLGQTEFAARVAQLAAEAPLPVWRSYLAMRLLDAHANKLPQAFADAHHEYHGRTITGLQAREPRAEEVLREIGGRYGVAPISMAVGELFVARAFPAEAQQRASQLVDDIKAAMRQRIEQLDWMSAPTKQRALAKLEAMVPKIGGPREWPRYAGLQLDARDYAGNALRAAAWAFDERLADLDRPVDRSRWFISPHIVNAFAGGLNEITFPAGILQPPFFDAKADDALNYGGIGMVIGHEITHHFDDRGRQYDAVGNLSDWWTPEDAAAYKARAQRVVQLYGAYRPLPDEAINGQLTLGENISDVAGLPIAYEGLQRALARSGGGAGKIDGYTPSQRFFLANALIWRGKTRTEWLINQLRTDSHSPGKFRVLGPMSQFPAFAQAFACKPGDPMAAAEPIRIW